MPQAPGSRTASIPERARRLEQLVDALGPRLYRVARGILADHHGAQDAVQEAFCRYWAQPPARDDPAAAYAWLRRVVVNECLNRLRRKTAVEVEAIETVGEGDAPGPVAVAGSTELYKRILELIGELPDAQRAALCLRVLEQLSYRQIARLLDCQVGTVMSRLHRARLTLIGRLRHMGLLTASMALGFEPLADRPLRERRFN